MCNFFFFGPVLQYVDNVWQQVATTDPAKTFYRDRQMIYKKYNENISFQF